MNAPVDMAAHRAGADRRLAVIDCDVHPYPKRGSLNQCLSERWRKHLAEYGKFNCGIYADRGTYPLFSPNTYRRDQAAALCGAMNDSQAHEFVDPEPRLRTSILVLVPQDDPDAASKKSKSEPDWRFCQIQLGSKTTEPRCYWLIFAAAQAQGMSIGLHVGGTQNTAPTASGWPQFYIEDHHGLAHSMRNQAASLILEDVFDAFPDLKVVLIEGGFAWVPQLGWRLDLCCR